MLEENAPLEGAMRKLTSSMKKGKLREELEELERELSAGVPIEEALGRGKLPELYRRMLEPGVRGNNLPGVLLIVADHYERMNSIWLRVKGLMAYPLILIIMAIGVGEFINFYLIPRFVSEMFDDMGVVRGSFISAFGLCLSLLILGAVFVPALCTGIPAVRRSVRWRVSPFRESALAEVASVIRSLLAGGCCLAEALSLAKELKAFTPAQTELTRWLERLEAGTTDFMEMTEGSGVFPPFYRWLVFSAGEDPSKGFERAERAYFEQANLRSEVFMLSLVPSSVILIGAVIGLHIFSVFVPLVNLMASISGRDGQKDKDVDRLIKSILGTVIYLGTAWAMMRIAQLLIALPLRRKERSLCLLELVQTALDENKGVEQTIASFAKYSEGGRWRWLRTLASHLEKGGELPEVLELLPGIVPERVAGILSAGSRAGSLKKVLPSCRDALGDFSSSQNAMNYVNVFMFSFAFMNAFMCYIFSLAFAPHMKTILYDYGTREIPSPLRLLSSHLMMYVFIAFGMGLCWFFVVLMGGGRFARRTKLGSLCYDLVNLWLPWRRRRLLRDFSSIPTILLDGGVPDAGAHCPSQGSSRTTCSS